MQEDLKELYRDELTGVYNRRYLNLILERELARTRRYGDTLSILILDLDNFKEINDAYGHLEGDKSLIKFAGILRESARDADTIVRYGGDEFVIIAPSTNYDGAYTLAKRILNNLAKVNTPIGPLSASIGIATYPDNGTDFKSLFEYADRCLYDAKRSGKGRVGLYKDSNLSPSIPTPVLVGRRKERSYIVQNLKEPGKIHLISGDAGIGKTRLVKDTFELMGLKFASGVAYGAITSMPYVVIRTLLLDMLKRFPVDLKQAFEKLSENSRYEIAKLVPKLLTDKSVKQDAGDKFTLFAGVSELLSELSREETIVVLMDDLHWADQLSLELIYYLLHMGISNLVIFATARSDEISGTPLESMLHILGRERLYDELVLGEMSMPEVKMLTEAILKRIPSDSLVKKIYDFSGGNPFFVEEFIRTMYDKGHLFYEDGAWILKEETIAELSNSIKDTVERKLERLDERDLNVLRYAACSGRDFYPDIIGGVVGMNVGEVFGILDKLVKNNILVEKDNGEVYSFKEDAIRLVVLNSMGEGVKKVIYNSIGEYLEGNFGVNSNNVEMILHYFELARNREKLVKYGELAGDRSQSVYAHENAIRYYEYALSGEEDPSKRGELHIKIGNAHLLLGKYEEALSHFEKALELLPEKRSEIEGRFIAYTYNLMGDREKAIYHYRKAIEVAKNIREKSGYRFMLAYHLVSKGEVKEAERITKEALSELPDEPEEVRALGYNTLALVYEGYKDDKYLQIVEEYFKKALEIAEKGKVGKRNIAAFYNNLAGFYATKGRYDEALPMFLEVKKIHEEMNFAYGKSLIYRNLAMLYRDMAKSEESIKYAEKGIKINSAIQKPHLNLPLYNILAEMLCERGEFKRAEEVLKKAIEIAKEGKDEKEEIRNMALFLKVRIEKGELDGISEIAGYLEEFMVNERKFVWVIFDALMVYYDAISDISSAQDLISFSEELVEDDNSMEYLFIRIWKLRVLGEGKEYFRDLDRVMNTSKSLSPLDRTYFLYRIADVLYKTNKRLAKKYIKEIEGVLDNLDLPLLQQKISSLKS